MGQLPRRFSSYLVTQSFDALNDNYFKMLIQLWVLQVALLQNSEEVISVATFLYTVPFVLFGPWSGYLADRFSKKKLMIWIKMAEIFVMILGAVAFYFQNLNGMIAVLFILAAQSTFFSPAKAGIIPEICNEASISKANSWSGLFTFFSILLGTALVGPLLAAHHNHAFPVSLYCIPFAACGTLFSFFIPTPKPTPVACGKFPLNPLRGIWENLVFLKRQKGLFLAALARSYFWLLGLIFSTNILIYGKNFLNLSKEQNTELALLPAWLGIGIALGSLLAGRWSGKKVELGLVPLGGFGLALTGLLLFLSVGSYVLTAVFLLFAGVCGGVYVVPLNSYLQFEAKPDEKGRVLSTAGILDGLFLVLGALIYRLMAVEFNFSAVTIYWVMGIVSFFVVVYICTVIPEYFFRFIAWLLAHTFYRIKIEGEENVPFHGPALLVPNHVSFVDALLVTATVQRFIKFVMYGKYFQVPILKQLCRIMEVIPIAPYKGRESVLESLGQARQKLLAGEVVCIFAEGKLTRDGSMNEFRSGFETIMQGVDCPIIPMYLHNVWGRLFTFSGGKVLFKWPRKIFRPITVCYGAPLPPTSTAAEVEQAVRLIASRFSPLPPQAPQDESPSETNAKPEGTT